MAALDDLTVRVRVDSRGLTRAIWKVRIALALLSGVAAVRRARAEILLVVAILGGWALVTWFVASFTTPRLWALSAGLLLLSLAGWKVLRRIATDGLYALTRGDRA